MYIYTPRPFDNIVTTTIIVITQNQNRTLDYIRRRQLRCNTLKGSCRSCSSALRQKSTSISRLQQCTRPHMLAKSWCQQLQCTLAHSLGAGTRWSFQCSNGRQQRTAARTA